MAGYADRRIDIGVRDRARFGASVVAELPSVIASLGGQVARWSSQPMLSLRFELPPLDLRIHHASVSRMDNTKMRADSIALWPCPPHVVPAGVNGRQFGVPLRQPPNCGGSAADQAGDAEAVERVDHDLHA